MNSRKACELTHNFFDKLKWHLELLRLSWKFYDDPWQKTTHPYKWNPKLSFKSDLGMDVHRHVGTRAVMSKEIADKLYAEAYAEEYPKALEKRRQERERSALKKL
jgi:hypothetical protein